MTENWIDPDACADSEIEACPLWESPLFLCTLSVHNLIKQPLLDLIVKQSNRQTDGIASQVAMTAKHQLLESPLDFLEQDDADIQLLNQRLSDLVLQVAGDVNAMYWPEDADPVVTLVESWYHVTRYGGYHDAHSHPNCSWSGIYYLKAGESDLATRSGVNRFYDPRTNADQFQDAGSLYLSNQGFWDFLPVEGQVILFPSYLKHSALPYFGHTDRIVLAFNARVDLLHGE
ncbi:MAG: 2OG-Fe(II) oxygenase family protein [Saccharospirillum sp.]|nr:2OG-Fe(II) oxygenase family protein [Saccharospirillum sp.]